MKKKVSPASLHCLKEALSSIFWYKRDLRSFLTQSLQSTDLVAKLDWDGYKRQIVSTLVDFMARNEKSYQDDLLELMYEVARMNDFSHLRRLDDGPQKELRAKESVSALIRQLDSHLELRNEIAASEKRRRTNEKEMKYLQSNRDKLEYIKNLYVEMYKASDAQKRGYELERVIGEIFEYFDLDPKAAFKIVGEQIDGAFTFDKTDYLLEVKWQTKPVSTNALYGLQGKLLGKLENTLGFFISINGFTDGAVSAVSSGRRLILLMDGADLMATLEGRIDLTDLLLRKRRAASQTGNIYLKIRDILG